MTQYVTAKVQKLEKPLTAWVLLAIICLLVSVYVCFVAGAVTNALAAKDMQSQIGALTSSIGGLESQYLAIKSSITLDAALAAGYVEPKGTIVYVPKAASESLSFNR